MKYLKNSKINSFLIIILTVIILFFLLKDNFFDVLDNLIYSNSSLLFVSFLIYVLYFLFEQLSLYFLTANIKKGISFKFILKIGIITKFFNGITPLSSGGQPYQVYELHKQKVPISKGTSIVIQNYILFQISLIIIAIFSLIINKLFNLFSFYPVLKHLTIIGFGINFIILIFLLIIGFSNRFNKASVSFILKLLNKINIIKNKDSVNEKWLKLCNDYHEGSQSLLKNKKTFALCLFFQFVSLLAYYSIPLFIAKALYINNINIFDTITASAYTFLMSCYIPLPGASGGVEYAFLSFFGNFVKHAKLTSLLLLWRFITFYLPCILGAVGLVFYQNKKEVIEKEK